MPVDGWTTVVPSGWLVAGGLTVLKATMVLLATAGAVWLLGALSVEPGAGRPAPAAIEDPAAVNALEEALSGADDRWVRKRIARALGETRRPSAVPVLRDLVGAGDRKVRRAALEGLVENGTDAAMEALDDVLRSRDPELRAMAARALGRRS